tara:strand:- start:74 stop:397 length:324 start_codon:yes stop_codon:yes gene_type:complete
MRFFNKEQILENVTDHFASRGYEDETYALADECIDLAEEWANNYDGDPSTKNKRQLRLELRKYIKSKIDLEDYKKAYFLPTFIWVWLAQQIIGWIVKFIIDQYTEQI